MHAELKWEVLKESNSIAQNELCREEQNLLEIAIEHMTIFPLVEEHC
jgi:hypothetical protein